jgi:hypothetical protein
MDKENQQQTKKQVVAWFRYQHLHNTPAHDNHDKFMMLLDRLEYYAETVLDDELDYWEQIKAMLNKINPEQMLQLKTLYKRH